MRPLILALPLVLGAALSLRAGEFPSAQVDISSAQWQRTYDLQLEYQADPVKAAAFAAAAGAEVDALCEKAPPNCGSARKLLADATTFAQQTPGLLDPGYGLPDMESRSKKIRLMFFRLFSIEEFTKSRLDALLAVIVNPMAAQFSAAETSLSQRLIILEGETKELEDKPLPEPGEVVSLKDDQLAAFDSFKSLSLGIDAYYDPDSPIAIARREKANELALKLAELRDRLIALELRAGLAPTPVVDLTETMRSRKMAELLMLTKKKKFGAFVKPEGGESFEVDFPVQSPRTWPTGPAPMGPEGPKKIPAKPGGVPKKKAEPKTVPVPEPDKTLDPPLDPKELSLAERRARLLRWLGLAEVAGEPKKRALLVHGQEGNSCAIVAQQQLLLAYGVLPGGDQVQLEDMLESSAAAAGYYGYKTGTPNKFMGNLLMEYGLIIVKHVDASDEELAAAAKTGKMLLVSVDPGLLWNDPKYLGSGHAILVTGVEFMKKSGTVLGYYINDSGYYGGVGGRFVPAEQFYKAWHGRGSRFIEVL